MADGAEIRFLRFAGRRVAYAVTGEGPPLVAPAWWISHLELDWADRDVPGASGSRLARATRSCATTGSVSACPIVRCVDEDLTLDG